MGTLCVTEAREGSGWNTTRVPFLKKFSDMEPIDTGRHFVFGIGSVMNAHSRRVQFPDALIIPCVAKGLRRGWWMCYDFHPINKDLPKSGLYDVVKGDCCVVVSMSPDDADAECAGVLCECSFDKLAGMDTREVGYQRKAIPNSQLCHLDGSLIELYPSDTVWVYAQPGSAEDAGGSVGGSAGGSVENGRPCVECPIIQSYLDIVI